MKFDEEKVDKRNDDVANLHLKPDTSDMIATIDADTVAYAVCSVCESGDDEAGWIINMDYALEEACSRIDNILHETGCKSCELHFTTGKNFRFALTGTYKANRTGYRTPVGLSDLKKLLLTKYPGLLHETVEADDYVAWQKRFWPDKYIVCSPDKDVYNGSVGIHFNYYKRAKGKYIKEDIPMRWVDTSREEAVIWVHMQALMGDSGDGIQGIPRCGPAKALKVLCPGLTDVIDGHKADYKADNGKALPADKLWSNLVIKHGILRGTYINEAKSWELVVQAYKEAAMTEKDAILTMRLVNMHQMTEEGDLELWTQPTQ